MSNTERTPIVDKNGKHTHVNKRVNMATGKDRISNLRNRGITSSRPLTVDPQGIYKKRDHDIIQLRQLTQHVKTVFGHEASSIKFETGDDGSWVLSEVTNDKGYPIWNLYESGEDLRSGDIEYKLATVNIDATIDEGLIEASDDGTFELDFDEINDKNISSTISAINNNTQTAYVMRNIVTSVYPDAQGIEFAPDKSLLRIRMEHGIEEWDTDKPEFKILPDLFSYIDEQTALDTKLFGLSGGKGNRIVKFDYLDKSRFPYD